MALNRKREREIETTEKENFNQKDPVFGKRAFNPLNKKSLTDFEMDEIFLEDGML